MEELGPRLLLRTFTATGGWSKCRPVPLAAAQALRTLGRPIQTDFPMGKPFFKMAPSTPRP